MEVFWMVGLILAIFIVVFGVCVFLGERKLRRLRAEQDARLKAWREAETEKAYRMFHPMRPAGGGLVGERYTRRAGSNPPPPPQAVRRVPAHSTPRAIPAPAASPAADPFYPNPLLHQAHWAASPAPCDSNTSSSSDGGSCGGGGGGD